MVKLFTSISALQSFRYPAPNMIQKHRSTQSATLFSHSVVSDSLWPHGLQHARLPCPSPSPRVCSNSCPLSRWYPPTISSSVVPLSSCFQSFPASGSLLMSQLFISVGQSIGASASASVLPMNIHSWFPDILAVQGTLKSLLQHHSSKVSILQCSAYSPTLTSIHDYWKNNSLTRQTFVGQVMSLLFNMLSRLIVTFLPRSKHLKFHGCSQHLLLFSCPLK